MKKFFTLLAVVGALAGFGPANSPAAVLESAEVTAAINSVSLLEPSGTPRTAAVGDILRGSSSLETGAKSRAELTFNDRTIARVGANSVFSFSRGTRDIELNRGVILMQVPKAAGGATIQTAAVTAAITGTTIAVEYSPRIGKFLGAIKIFVLEGTLRAFLKAVAGESLLLGPGQMIALLPDAKRLPDPQVFDIQRLMATAGLLSDQFGELPSNDIILENIVLQNAEKAKGRLLISNYTLNARVPAVTPFLQQTSDVNMRIFAKAPAPTPRVIRAAAPRPLPPPRPVPVLLKPHCPPVPPSEDFPF